MLRQSVRGVRLPLKAFGQPIEQGAWNGAWRRLFASQAKSRVSSELWRWREAPWQGLLAKMRPKTLTTPGPLQGVLRRGFRFSARRKTNKGPDVKEGVEPTGIKARLKKLIKDYGWVTLGVYIGLTILDFPFCFLFVRAVGTEAIGKVEHSITSTFKEMIPEYVKEAWHSVWQSFKKAEAKALGDDDISDKMEMATWGVERANERNNNAASLATQLAFAYAIHKSFIFLRVPLTAWLTPRVAKLLQSWGWKIGKKKST
ncbi:hypothetical protein B0J13DRAFT_307027 [Dactylonectria estremocensis]|uniref:DUF1279 domain-containing protein n=1 Tax=Dactylonectria estremocensis TaxID=1079267 RepID=A0A9P9F1T3_9HYPO|nr:hypothetical protein B0J13DRAFT_307027 [Dactylonectria estremocensis]